jgi:hypothetical protein
MNRLEYLDDHKSGGNATFATSCRASALRLRGGRGNGGTSDRYGEANDDRVEDHLLRVRSVGSARSSCRAWTPARGTRRSPRTGDHTRKMNSPNVFLARAAVTAAAVLLACGPLPAVADGQDAAPPITIDRCTMSEHPRIQDPERAGPRVSAADGLTIVYSNDRDVAASEVHFRARYQGQTLDLVDRGSFASHVKLSREFNHFNVIFGGSPADCFVTSVTFSDGSRWDAPAEAASPAPGRRRDWCCAPNNPAATSTTKAAGDCGSRISRRLSLGFHLR